MDLKDKSIIHITFRKLFDGQLKGILKKQIKDGLYSQSDVRTC